MVVHVPKIDDPSIVHHDRHTPWCGPRIYAAVFILKGPKTKNRKVPRVLHAAVNRAQKLLVR